MRARLSGLLISVDCTRVNTGMTAIDISRNPGWSNSCMMKMLRLKIKGDTKVRIPDAAGRLEPGG